MMKKTVYLVASGDLRLSANRVCWAAQKKMESEIFRAVRGLGGKILRGHPFKKREGHGFISSQREGMDVFAKIPADAPVIVAESVWQYSHHVLAGLVAHRGPILTLANWSGQWPGLVGMLNLNGSLTKAGVAYSTLWAEDFRSPEFTGKLGRWLKSGRLVHPMRHVREFDAAKCPASIRGMAKLLAREFMTNKAILGVFDEGCMGMYNAIIPDELLFPMGIYKERLSQSALYAAMQAIPDREAREVYQWLVKKGMTFKFGKKESEDLTPSQVLAQCKMYLAACRIGDEFGCDAIGIQYQQGLKDLTPASDLVEGLLNNSDRPPVRNPAGKVIKAGEPFTHFNEVDECAGLDGLFTQRVHKALGQPVENTLHDLRWADWDKSGTTKDYVWVFEISGAAPAAHHIGGYRGSVGERQPSMFFPKGGSTLKGVAKPGEIVWSRIYIEGGRLQMDIGLAEVVALPKAETERRLKETTPQWPIMHAVLKGVTRDQMMARHKANHIQVAYAKNAVAAGRCLQLKAALAEELGIRVFVCGLEKRP